MTLLPKRHQQIREANKRKDDSKLANTGEKVIRVEDTSFAYFTAKNLDKSEIIFESDLAEPERETI